MNQLVSIIIPVYNVAPFLRRCLDSVIAQTYRCIEIILVNDGSTDESGKICDEYSLVDNRILVIHQSNSGVGAARNHGLNVSQGEYVVFVDSDDTIAPAMIENMLKNAIAYKVDISCCLLDVVEINGNCRRLVKHDAFLATSKEVLESFFTDQFIKDQMYGPCNKLFRKEILSGLHFKPYKLGEDILFCFEALTKCKLIYFDDYIGYHYLHRQGSAMTSSFSSKRLDYVSAAREIESLCCLKVEYAKNDAHRWVYFHILGTLRQIYANKLASEYRDFVVAEKKFLKQNRKYLDNLSLARKLDYFCILYFPLYFRLLKFVRK